MKKSIWDKKHVQLRKSLKQLRKGKGLTQVELADLLNKPQSYVSKYENGDKRLDFIEVEEICIVCKISLRVFLSDFYECN